MLDVVAKTILHRVRCNTILLNAGRSSRSGLFRRYALVDRNHIVDKTKSSFRDRPITSYVGSLNMAKTAKVTRLPPLLSSRSNETYGVSAGRFRERATDENYAGDLRLVRLFSFSGTNRKPAAVYHAGRRARRGRLGFKRDAELVRRTRKRTRRPLSNYRPTGFVHGVFASRSQGYARKFEYRSAGADVFRTAWQFRERINRAAIVFAVN